MSSNRPQEVIMAEEFTGFANAPVDKKGKRLDFRDVEAFVDESDEGKIRTASQTTVSTVATGKPQPEPEVTEDADGDPGADDSTDTTTAKAAGGKEASGS